MPAPSESNVLLTAIEPARSALATLAHVAAPLASSERGNWLVQLVSSIRARRAGASTHRVQQQPGRERAQRELTGQARLCGLRDEARGGGRVDGRGGASEVAARVDRRRSRLPNTCWRRRPSRYRPADSRPDQWPKPEEEMEARASGPSRRARASTNPPHFSISTPTMTVPVSPLHDHPVSRAGAIHRDRALREQRSPRPPRRTRPPLPLPGRWSRNWSRPR